MKRRLLQFLGVYLTCLSIFYSDVIFAHAGSHGNDECTFEIAGIELRINGYQFKGKNPDKHYCRNYPHLGQTIIKVDSVNSDLSKMGIELQLLKRQSWWGLISNADDAFSVNKQLPIQYFSKQVVSISSDIETRDIYALKMRLHTTDGKITEYQRLIFIGVPFVQVLVGISVVLLILISIIFLQQLRKA